MNKIQYKIALIFAVLISFIVVSLFMIDNATHDNTRMLTQGAKQRQTKLLALLQKITQRILVSGVMIIHIGMKW